MDNWQWVRTLDPEVNGPMYDLSSAVCDARYDRVDSLIPVLLDLARTQGLPWVEVFARHWELQSLVLHQKNPKVGLPKAVELLERAHRDDTVDCPQTVCVSQDLCSAYGQMDGPGYAAERIHVSDETLSRINPRWDCWSCISAEKGRALLDAGDVSGALEFLDESDRACKRVGAGTNSSDVISVRIKVLIAAGRLDDALALAGKRQSAEYSGDSFGFDRTSCRILVLSKMGRTEEALAELPSIQDVLHFSTIDTHAKTLKELVTTGAIPLDDQRIGELRQMVDASLSRGAYREAFDAAEIACQLAMSAGEHAIAGAFRERAQRAADDLRDPNSVRANLDTLGAELGSNHPPVDGQRWAGLGFYPQALVHFRQAFAQAPNDSEAFSEVAKLLLDMDDLDALECLLTECVDIEPLTSDALWYSSFMYQRRGRSDDEVAVLNRLAAREPGWVGVHWRLAHCLEEAGDLPAALSAYTATIEVAAGPGDYDWDRMIVAQRLGAHDLVRESALRLEMDLSSDEGPIEENWGGCLIRYEDDTDVYARRTGPVTARIMRLALDGQPERYHDNVAITPSPQNPDAGEHALPIYPHVETLSTGNFQSFSVDGLDPGEGTLDPLIGRLESLGYVFDQKSGNEYQIIDPETGDDRDGIYAKVGFPAEQPLEALHEVLLALSDEFGLEMWVWIDLVAAIDAPDELARQTQRSQEWGL